MYSTVFETLSFLSESSPQPIKVDVFVALVLTGKFSDTQKIGD